MEIKQHIESDLKAAMLGGDKVLVTTLRGIKSAILYAEVAAGKRDEGLSEQELFQLLAKEAKRRQESADLFKQGGNNEKAEAELVEKKVIEAYLPEQMGEDAIASVVDKVIGEISEPTMRQMGQVIGEVKKRTEGQADGAIIARLVKERLQ